MTTVAQRSRPALVTVAVVLWLLVLALQVVVTVVQVAGAVRADGAWVVVPAAIGVGLCVWFASGALRVGRGSARARFWMAVLGVLGFIGGLVPPYDARVVTGVLFGVAAVLPYLPSARPFFPRSAPRGASAPARRVVGWDPETGEPIRATD